MSTIAIIQARQGSTRLSGKALVKLNGRTCLSRVVSALKAVNSISPEIDDIVIATTKNEEDNLIQAWCVRHGVKCYRGSSENVLERFYRCAMAYKADWVLRITADCPLLNPFLVWGLLTKEPRKKYQALAFNRGGIPAGWDAELFSMQELELIYKRVEIDEHVSTKMRNAGSDAYEDYGLPFDFKGVKYDLDTEEDFKRIEQYLKVLEGEHER